MNVLGEFDSNGYICIDMKQDNMLVVHPDFLVSGSVIASATTCVRRLVVPEIDIKFSSVYLIYTAYYLGYHIGLQLSQYIKPLFVV